VAGALVGWYRSAALHGKQSRNGEVAGGALELQQAMCLWRGAGLSDRVSNGAPGLRHVRNDSHP